MDVDTEMLPSKYHSEPSRENPHSLTRNQFIWRRTKATLNVLIPLFCSIGYLAFCYTVKHHIVLLRNLGPFSITQDNLGSIKSGITTLNIAIVTLALYPVSDLLLVLKSEEFFHALIQRTSGVPLSTINTISSPIFGTIDSLHAIIAGRCSRFFVLATFASFIVYLTSILAPTALSIQTVLADGDIVALPVGAVANNSVYNTSSSITSPDETNVQDNADFAASVFWAEMYLGVQYNFATAASTEADFSAFIVPQPLNLPMTSAARWLTDVIGLRPSCTWASPNITQPIIVPNQTVGISPVAGVYLEDMDLDVVVDALDIGPGNSLAMITVKNPMPPSVINHTTLSPPTDGSTVFLAGQCMSGCPTYSYNDVWLNFTGIPTFTIQLPFSTPDITGYQLWHVAFLVCKPNAIIETREVRAEGDTKLIVQPLSEGEQLIGQGNISPLDATTMLSFALSGITLIGPSNSSDISGLGSNPQQNFLFGSQQVNAWPNFVATSDTEIVNASFLPITNLSEGFAQILQSASKGYVSGYLGSAFVPARFSTFEVVFVSSLSLVTFSTVAFILLYIVVGVLHLREKGEEFNLPNIARTLHGSNLPEGVSQLVREVDGGNGGHYSERDVIEKIGDRAVILHPCGDGSHVLRVT